MTTFVNNVEFGHAIPPEGPHTITTHLPGWETVAKMVAGDMSVISRVKSIYPRFAPFGLAREFSLAVHKKLALPQTHMCMVFAAPDAAEQVGKYARASFHEEQNRATDDDAIIHRVVEMTLPEEEEGDAVVPVRLHVVAGPMARIKVLPAAWQIVGAGASTRLAEALLPRVEASLVDVTDADDGGGPAPGLPETAAHEALRSRIVSLLRRAPVDPDRAAMVGREDVLLFPSGMSAVHRTHEALTALRPGRRVLVFGSVFKNTWQMFGESAGGIRHFGRCVLDEVKGWLEEEAREGRGVSYCFLEFPSNPILVAADLVGLSRLAEKYNFPLVVDDTVGSFANIDLLPVADVIVSSTTKSFSGYADVMGGCVVLNPSRPAFHALISPVFTARFINEVFSGDAAQLLSNSADYLARTAVLNRNAASLAAWFASPENADLVAGVNYPSLPGESKTNYDAMMRRPTNDLVPGYGCLLSVDFATMEAAMAFYDASAFFQGPHLGAHRTLVCPFSFMAWSAKRGEMEYHAAYGCVPAQVRVSVGLETVEELVGAAAEAMRKARTVVTP